MSSLHVVLGATGGAGSAIARELLAHDIPVRTVSRASARAQAAAEHRTLDITDSEQAGAAVRGAAVVHMAAQPLFDRWPEQFPAMLRTVAAAVAAEGAKLIMVDNAYAYGPLDGPADESTPEGATDAKGRTRAAMTASLLAAHAAGDLRVAIGRASDYMGPDAPNSAITALAIEPAGRRRGSLRWLGALDVPHSVAYLPDVARGYWVLATDDRADGRTWHLPHSGAPTGCQLLGLVNDQLERPRAVRRVSPLALRLAAPVHMISRETLAIIHQWDRPFVIDDTAFTTTFDIAATPLVQAVAETLDGERARAVGRPRAHPRPTSARSNRC